MPIYQLKCEKCGYELEETMLTYKELQEEKHKICPCCGEPNSLSQVYGTPALNFKGDGWYVTDYKKKPEN